MDEIIKQNQTQQVAEGKLVSTLYKVARFGADVNAVQSALNQKSLSPIERRLIRKAIGRRFGSFLGGIR